MISRWIYIDLCQHFIAAEVSSQSPVEIRPYYGEASIITTGQSIVAMMMRLYRSVIEQIAHRFTVMCPSDGFSKYGRYVDALENISSWMFENISVGNMSKR